MRITGFVKFFAFTLLCVVCVGTLSLLCLNLYGLSISGRHHREFLGFLAQSIEQILADEALTQHDPRLARIEQMLSPKWPPPGHEWHGGPPGPPPSSNGPPGPPPPGPPPGMPGHPVVEFWLVNEGGEILSHSQGAELPIAWSRLNKPREAHDVTTAQSLFGFGTTTSVIRLNLEPALYLVSSEKSPGVFGPMMWVQAIMTFASLAVALILSATFTFFYLRRKSSEARAVLYRLETGDLKARFSLERFDEFGGLMSDFNRMAGEIERLVDKVHNTEATRKNLLQELGHDLRTPLTSLTTSFETLREHFDHLPKENRNELLEMVGAEIEYMRELVEKLISVSSIDEPGFKTSTEVLNLADLLSKEIEVRNSSGHLRWQLELSSSASAYQSLGDAQLIQRLFKNAFDNAARFATSRVRVSLAGDDQALEVNVVDDGPGLTSTALESFGKRRGQRTRREGAKLNFSLGLGSVIMRTISELHGGSIEIANVVDRENIRGAVLRVRLPRLSREVTAGADAAPAK